MPFGGLLTAGLLAGGGSLLGALGSRGAGQQTRFEQGDQHQDYLGDMWSTPRGSMTAPIPPEYMEHLLRAQGLSEDQMGMLQQMLGTSAGRQNDFLSFLTGDLGNLNSQLWGQAQGGLDPRTRAALTANAVEAGAPRGEDGAMRLDLARRGLIGGGLPAGGEYARLLMPLQAQRERTRAGLMRDMEVQEQGAIERNFGRRAGLLGQAGNWALQGANLMDPTRLAALMNQTLNTRANLMPPVMPTAFQTQQQSSGTQHGSNMGNVTGNLNMGNPWLQSLGGAAASVGMGLLGGGQAPWWLPGGSGGSGTGMSTGGYGRFCWIAEAIYGVDDPRTHLARFWLANVWDKRRFGHAVLNLYRKYGERVARVVKRNPNAGAGRVLRALFRPLFDMAVRKAMRDIQ